MSFSPFDSIPYNCTDDIVWNMPTLPRKYDLAVADGKSVVLIRHFFAENGDVEKIYGKYLDDKIAENNI